MMEELANDLVVMIREYLDIQENATCNRICKLFNKSNNLWMKRIWIPIGISNYIGLGEITTDNLRRFDKLNRTMSNNNKLNKTINLILKKPSKIYVRPQKNRLITLRKREFNRNEKKNTVKGFFSSYEVEGKRRNTLKRKRNNWIDPLEKYTDYTYFEKVLYVNSINDRTLVGNNYQFHMYDKMRNHLFTIKSKNNCYKYNYIGNIKLAQNYMLINEFMGWRKENIYIINYSKPKKKIRVPEDFTYENGNSLSASLAKEKIYYIDKDKIKCWDLYTGNSSCVTKYHFLNPTLLQSNVENTNMIELSYKPDKVNEKILLMDIRTHESKGVAECPQMRKFYNAYINQIYKNPNKLFIKEDRLYIYDWRKITEPPNKIEIEQNGINIQYTAVGNNIYYNKKYSYTSSIIGMKEPYNLNKDCIFNTGIIKKNINSIYCDTNKLIIEEQIWYNKHSIINTNFHWFIY